jgi:VanZ family protein
MKKNKTKKIIAGGLILVWASVIFELSAMPGSANHYYNLFYFLERKSFHIIEYFILGNLFYFYFSLKFTQKKTIIFSIILTLLYAMSDEWHQTFVFGRDGRIRDVVIDSIGILLAMFLILKIKQWKKKKQLN